MNDEQPTVFIVDDDVSVRDALKNLLRSVGLRVETFETAEAFIAADRSAACACLVLDVRLPGLSGLDLQRRLVELDIQIPVTFITAHGDIPMSVRALKAGAVDFLSKPFRDQDLLDAVQEALARDRAWRREQARTAQVRERHRTLTAREREVMALVVAGLANKQIADQLNVSEATVKLHRGQVMRKMEARSLAALVTMAGRLGLDTDH